VRVEVPRPERGEAAKKVGIRPRAIRHEHVATRGLDRRVRGRISEEKGLNGGRRGGTGAGKPMTARANRKEAGK